MLFAKWNRVLAATMALGLTGGMAAYAYAGDGCTGCTYSKASTTMADAGKGDYDKSKKDKSIVAVAQKAGNFSTLLAAAQAAGLAETLAEKGPFTVLAPTDEAFAALPAGTVEELLKPENKEKLQQVLLYHVIDGSVMAETVTTLDSATTLQGGTIAISVTDDGVMLNDSAKVVKTDIEASNGVIHVINAVLMPPAKTAAAE